MPGIRHAYYRSDEHVNGVKKTINLTLRTFLYLVQSTVGIPVRENWRLRFNVVCRTVFAVKNLMTISLKTEQYTRLNWPQLSVVVSVGFPSNQKDSEGCKYWKRHILTFLTPPKAFIFLLLLLLSLSLMSTKQIWSHQKFRQIVFSSEICLLPKFWWSAMSHDRNWMLIGYNAFKLKTESHIRFRRNWRRFD